MSWMEGACGAGDGCDGGSAGVAGETTSSDCRDAPKVEDLQVAERTAEEVLLLTAATDDEDGLKGAVECVGAPGGLEAWWRPHSQAYCCWCQGGGRRLSSSEVQLGSDRLSLGAREERASERLGSCEFGVLV